MNEEFKNEHTLIHSLKEIHLKSKNIIIDGQVFIGSINLNEVIENAPPDLDTLKEIAANIKSSSGNSNNMNNYFNKVESNTQIVNANVVLSSNVSISGNLTLSIGTGVLHSTNGVITSSNVVTSDLQNNSVTYSKMQTLGSGNVLLGGNIAGSTVTETKVYTDMIADGAITSSKLASGVGLSGNASLTSLTVTGNTELNSNVSVGNNLSVAGNSSLNTLSVTGNAVLNSNVSISGNLTLSTGTGVLHSTNGVITSSNVVTSDLQNNSVTYSKMQTLVNSNVLLGGNLAGSTVTETKVYTDMIADGAITASKLAPGVGGASGNTTLSSLTVTGNSELNSNVNIGGNLILSTGTGVLHSTNGVITSSNVVTSDLQNNSVTYSKMQTLVNSNVLLGGNLAGSTVTETKVYTDMIADGAITASKLSNDAIVNYGNVILDGNLNTLNVSGNSRFNNITTSGSVNFNSNVSISGNLTLSTGTGVLHSTNGVITSSNVVTSDLQNNSVTYSKMQTLVNSNVLLGGNTAGSTITETKVYTDMIADGAITANKLAAGAATQTLNFTEGSNISSASTINNYNLGVGSFYKLTGTTASTISGFNDGTTGRYIVVINNTDKNQTFAQEDTNSNASSRFVLGVSNKTIGINQAATFIYVTGLTISGNSGQSRWVLTSTT